jgi:alanine dehydrogenase
MTHADPVFIEEDVIHYCVPNVTGVVARTATHAFLNGAWKYIESITSNGLEGALQQRPALVRGLAVHGGKVLNPNLALLNQVEKSA